MSRGWHMSVEGVLLGCNGCFTGVLQRCYKGVKSVIQVCYMGITSVLEDYHRCVMGWCEGVASMLYKCYISGTG